MRMSVTPMAVALEAPPLVGVVLLDDPLRGDMNGGGI